MKNCGCSYEVRIRSDIQRVNTSSSVKSCTNFIQFNVNVCYWEPKKGARIM